VCLYNTKKERYETECIEREDLEGMTEGDFIYDKKKRKKSNLKKKKKGEELERDGDLVIHSCGCCEGQDEHNETPGYCFGSDSSANPMEISGMAGYHCDEDKNGKLKVEFCFYDVSRKRGKREKRKCKDPFNLGMNDEDTFLNWGSCS
jgi:hypothetical protein